MLWFKVITRNLRKLVPHEYKYFHSNQLCPLTGYINLLLHAFVVIYIVFCLQYKFIFYTFRLRLTLMMYIYTCIECVELCFLVVQRLPLSPVNLQTAMLRLGYCGLE